MSPPDSDPVPPGSHVAKRLGVLALLALLAALAWWLGARLKGV